MAALVWGADRFVAGAAGIAAHRGISQLVIGITVVALGTSAPEIAVAIHACLEGNPLLAVGNAVGSNIANIGLVLAVTAIVVPCRSRWVYAPRNCDGCWGRQCWRS